jgi:hypothetical protein
MENKDKINKRDTIEGILWGIAMIGTIGLLIALYTLKGITKKVSEYKIQRYK